ncbi:MAG TPA: hypothetical protein DCL60_00840 [Armatimonadetes bacterium]|jgi:energy-coupling factor transporter transmembrane protein EcfT|nr:hypothetical protein [Armatimonadota bacterium]
MDLYYIDYISVYGRSWMHRVPAAIKMIALALIILLLLNIQTIPLLSAMLAAVILIAITAHLPVKTVFVLMLYPSLFLVILFFSITGITVAAVLIIILRVFAITGAVVVFFLTTSYPAIFSILSRFLPGFMIAALFFTYRSIFIISDSLNNIRTMFHLRGGINYRHPAATLSRLGTALGHFLVHSIEMSQRISDALKVRGFKNRIYHLGDKNG